MKVDTDIIDKVIQDFWNGFLTGNSISFLQLISGATAKSKKPHDFSGSGRCRKANSQISKGANRRRDLHLGKPCVWNCQIGQGDKNRANQRKILLCDCINSKLHISPILPKTEYGNEGSSSSLAGQRTKNINNKMFWCLQGSSKSGFLGEVSIDFADLAEATKPLNLTLPLQTSKSGAVLHVSSSSPSLLACKCTSKRTKLEAQI